MFLMLSTDLAIDQNVIKVSSNKNVQVFSQNIIHRSLKHSRYTSEFKGHHQEFIQLKSDVKDHELFLSFLHSEPVESRDDVQLSEVFHFT